MLNLKKLLALTAMGTMGLVACDAEEDASADALVCPSIDETDANPAPVTVETDGGPVETCPDAPTGGTGGAGGEAPPVGGDAPPADPTVSLAFAGNDLNVTIVTGADEGDFFFGMAETGNGAMGWYGEDCILGIKNDYDICHPVPADGALSLAKSPIGEIGTKGEEEVQGNGKTIVGAALAPGLTYVLIRAGEDNEGCWTWGHNTGYYKDSELGCNEITPVAAP